MTPKTIAGDGSALRYFPAPPADDTPIAEVLSTWQRVEPGRYTPLRYGGLLWLNRTPEKPTRLLTHEFAAAIEALQQRSWPFELFVDMTGKTVAQITYAPNRVATAGK